MQEGTKDVILFHHGRIEVGDERERNKEECQLPWWQEGAARERGGQDEEGRGRVRRGRWQHAQRETRWSLQPGQVSWSLEDWWIGLTEPQCTGS